MNFLNKLHESITNFEEDVNLKRKTFNNTKNNQMCSNNDAYRENEDILKEFNDSKEKSQLNKVWKSLNEIKSLKKENQLLERTLYNEMMKKDIFDFSHLPFHILIHGKASHIFKAEKIVNLKGLPIQITFRKNDKDNDTSILIVLNEKDIYRAFFKIDLFENTFCFLTNNKVCMVFSNSDPLEIGRLEIKKGANHFQSYDMITFNLSYLKIDKNYISQIDKIEELGFKRIINDMRNSPNIQFDNRLEEWSGEKDELNEDTSIKLNEDAYDKLNEEGEKDNNETYQEVIDDEENSKAEIYSCPNSSNNESEY